MIARPRANAAMFAGASRRRARRRGGPAARGRAGFGRTARSWTAGRARSRCSSGPARRPIARASASASNSTTVRPRRSALDGFERRVVLRRRPPRGRSPAGSGATVPPGFRSSRKPGRRISECSRTTSTSTDPGAGTGEWTSPHAEGRDHRAAELGHAVGLALHDVVKPRRERDLGQDLAEEQVSLAPHPRTASRIAAGRSGCPRVRDLRDVSGSGGGGRPSRVPASGRSVPSAPLDADRRRARRSPRRGGCSAG